MSKRSVRRLEEETKPQDFKSYERVEKIDSDLPNSIAVQSQIDAKVRVTGYVTGNSYVFNGAGSVVYVDEKDVEKLLEKRQGGRQCCGGTGNGNAVFSLVEVT